MINCSVSRDSRDPGLKLAPFPIKGLNPFPDTPERFLAKVFGCFMFADYTVDDRVYVSLVKIVQLGHRKALMPLEPTDEIV